MGLQCAPPRVEPNLCLRNAFGLSEADAPTSPPCFDVCTLLSPAALCSLCSPWERGQSPQAICVAHRWCCERAPKICSAVVGLEQVWGRFGCGVSTCGDSRAYEGRRSWGRTLPSPFFPCLLSPACFPTPHPHPLRLRQPTTWLPLSSEEGEPGACSAVFRFVRPPAAWQACALWGSDLEASLPCCRCRLRFGAVWPSTVEVLPIR